MRRILSDTVNQARPSEVLTAEPVRSRRRPRDWSDDEKAPIVAASLQPGPTSRRLHGLKDWTTRSFMDGVVRRLHLVLFHQ